MRSRIKRPRLLTALVAASVTIGCSAPAMDTDRQEVDRISSGIAFFEARVAQDPLDNLSRRQLVGRYGERFRLAADFDDVARAETLARDLLTRSTDGARNWSRLSALLLMQHRFAEALSAADSALAADPENQEAIGASYDASLAIGYYPRAFAALRRLPPRQVASQARWVGWHLASGNKPAAWGAQEQVCRALDRGSAPSLPRAWCLTELGRQAADPAEAGAIFERALAVQPGYRGAVEGLANLAHARGDWRTSRRLYRSILSDAHPDLHRRLAEAELGLGHPAVAAEEEARFSDLVSGPGQEALQGPEIIRSHLARGGRYLDSALAVALREVGRRPTIESWTLLAGVYRARGDQAGEAGAQTALAKVRREIALARVPPTGR